jgi:hypothetical protein
VIVHEASVQKSRRKPMPLWRGGLLLTGLPPNLLDEMAPAPS